MARLPQYWEAKSGTRKVRETRYTTAQGRWLAGMGLTEWNPRGKSRAKGRSKAKPSRPMAETSDLDLGAHTDNTLVTSRETSVLPDPGIDALLNQYPLPPAYHGADNPWVTPRETGIYPDPGSNAFPDYYSLPSSSHHPSFDFPHLPPTYPTNHFDHQPFDNLINGELNDFDDDGMDDIINHRSMSPYLDPDFLDIDPMLEHDQFSGLENL